MSMTTGDARKRRRLTKTIEERDANGRTSLPPEPTFRGFELIPKVSLQPLDLKLFLINSKIASDQNNQDPNLSLHRNRLSLNCTVELLREDLVKLKETFERKSPVDCGPDVKLPDFDIILPAKSFERNSLVLLASDNNRDMDCDPDAYILPDSNMALAEDAKDCDPEFKSPNSNTVLPAQDNKDIMDCDPDVKFSDSNMVPAKDNDKDIDCDPDVKLPDFDIAALPDVKSTIVLPNSGQLRCIESALAKAVNLKCKICEKEYSNEKKLQNHQEKKHMIVYQPSIIKTPKRVSFSDHVIIHEVTEYHKCRKCPKIFESYKFLKKHMRDNHKKRKNYVCDYCDTKFMDRMFFKVHIKLHCDVCKLLLANRTEYLEHRRNICRVLKLYNCKTCNNAFFNFMDLKDHSYEHINTYFICDICKEQFTTKCGVAHHISFLHTEKRPTTLYDMRLIGLERLYLCNFCDESSMEREIIEKHVEVLPDLFNKVMTGYKDFYFCDQCSKKFDTEKDMLQHKWSHFLKNSDNSQIRPNGILSKSKPGFKMFYNINEKLPSHMHPKLVLERIKFGGKELKEPVILEKELKEPVNLEKELKEPVSLETELKEPVSSEKESKEQVSLEKELKEPVSLEKELNEPVSFIDVNNFDINNVDSSKKAVVDPKSKKTIISKFQCQFCGKYLSSNYCLNRHIKTVHLSYSDLQCKVCEEVFVWPSLLKSHKCIRYNIPEMPFDDARPEIHFENLHEMYNNGIDDLNISENEDYMNNIDFEIPAPIVELTEYENSPILNNINNANQNSGKDCVSLPILGYRVVVQEVPIEF